MMGISSALPVCREVVLATLSLQRLVYMKVACLPLVAQAGRSVPQSALADRLVQKLLQVPVSWSVLFHRSLGSK